jgi:hypothetical protein
MRNITDITTKPDFNENQAVLENDVIKVVVGKYAIAEKEEFYTERVMFWSGKDWNTLFTGIEGQEFCTSFKKSGAQKCEFILDEGGKRFILSSRNEIWEAEEELAISSSESIVERRQKYRFLRPCEGYINPGYMVRSNNMLRYTYPLQVYDKPLKGLPALRCDSAWAVPVPCHILNTDQWVAIYGIDRNAGAGTLDFQPLNDDGDVRLGTFYPDTVEQSKIVELNPANRKPEGCKFSAGQEIELVEFISVKRLEGGEFPLLEAEKLAAKRLLKEPFPRMDWVECANRIANFYHEGSLWEPNAFEQGRGWFRNMWVYTTGKTPEKNPYFDLGWGEGYGVLTMNALALNWKRTGNPKLMSYLNEMTENLDYFKRSPGEEGLYYDRYKFSDVETRSGADAHRGTDFMGCKRIWSHCLGNIGYQLLNLYRSVKDYPNVEIRRKWLNTGMAIGEFFARHQRDNGDVQDGFEANGGESNRKRYRIPARAVVCGLWSVMAEISGDGSYLQRARKLAGIVSEEIERFDFYGQMLDTHHKDAIDIWDAENACYAALGLTELYLATFDEKVNRLCKISAAYLFTWVYYYNLPNGYNGWTRGGTTCRMPDYPLLYVGAGALAFIPLVRLAEKTGELFYKQMAEEILGCIAKYQWRCPDKPWDGGIVHALDQNSGAHWGPERLGQVDSGMTTGMGLADLEYWIEKNKPAF